LIRITSSTSFIKEVKKFHINEQQLVEQAIIAIATSPSAGRAKIDDLTGIYVYKFRAVGRTLLTAYAFLSEEWIQLLKVGSHENFYRDLKRGK
jgi:mRNA-degrading endonuclease YafQ of YafQ-DinJ toxin-antitoxin module